MNSRHKALARLLGLEHKFETDPAFQYRLHIVMTYFWLVNACFAVAVYVFDRPLWDKASVFYLVLVSLYANFATDYGSVPGAEAAIAGEHVEGHLRVNDSTVDVSGDVKETPE